MVKFTENKREIQLISKIVDRAKELSPKIDRISLLMDISATHVNGNELDLERLLKADDFNFSHDIAGIVLNIDRTTGKLKNCFLPRFTNKKQ